MWVHTLHLHACSELRMLQQLLSLANDLDPRLLPRVIEMVAG